MKNLNDEIRQEWTALQACFDTVRQLAGNREVGRYLCEELANNRPYLAKYWRAAASRAAFTPAMMTRLKIAEFPRLRGMIIEHTLLREAGVSPTLLAKVFEKIQQPPIEELIVPQGGLTVRFTSCGSIPVGHATVVFEWQGRRFGNGSFLLNADGQAGMAALRAAGVPFEIPSYVSPMPADSGGKED